MDKSFSSIEQQSIKVARRSVERHVFLRYLTLLFASVLVLYNAYSWIVPNSAVPHRPSPKVVKDKFEWSDIEPSSSFGFHKCFDEYECARLDVPLDWSAPVEEQKRKRAAVAIVRVPAKVTPTSPRYGGAILVNPGGPGGSGVHLAMALGKHLQKIIDTGFDPSGENKTSLYYDIIGFDPRGVNHTTPSPDCFPDDTSRQLWTVSREAVGLLAENSTFPLVWSRNKALAESCSKKLSEDWSKIGKYMNTPQVAADMVAIIEALGEWRERNGQELLSKIRCHKDQAQEIAHRTKWNKGKEKLLYVGFSYGTLLGETFATMYPDKIHRVVLDGVCDAEDYYSGTWLGNLIDTDDIIGSFFRQCYEAGPIACPLWTPDGIDSIRKRYHGLLDKLKGEPVSVDAHGRYAADVITLSDAMNVVRQAVYQPHQWWSKLATSFSLLEQGNGTALAAMKQDSHVSTCRSPSCSTDPYGEDCYTRAVETFKDEMSAGILCTDGPADQQKWEAADHFAKWHALREQSRALGDFWAEITMYCANWNVRPAWNFNYSSITAPGAIINTSHPILFASMKRDPVTPLRNAVKMAKKFRGAGLVTLEDDGHCSMYAPSLCVAGRISRYFQLGEVPREDVECVPDRLPFEGLGHFVAVGEEVRELVEAMHGFAGVGELRQRRSPLGVL